MLKEIVGQEKTYDDSDSDCDFNDVDLKYESETDFNELQNECIVKCNIKYINK